MSESSQHRDAQLSRADSVTVIVHFLNEERVESLEDWIIEATGLDTTNGLAAKVSDLAFEPGSMPRYSLTVTERRIEWGASGESIEFVLTTAGDRATEAALAFAFAELAQWLRRHTRAVPDVPDEQSVVRHAKWAACVSNNDLSSEDFEVLGVEKEPGTAIVRLLHAPSQTLYTVRLSIVDDVVHRSSIKWERLLNAD